MMQFYPDENDHVARPVIAIGHDYPGSFELAEHRHRRSQFLYAASGVMAVSTPSGAWVAPPERAVWIPGGTPHSVRMVGAVQTRSVLVEPGECPGRGSSAKWSGCHRCFASCCPPPRMLRPNMMWLAATDW
ncbi:hypothetical protein [Sphingopyxis sp.]|uniref:AraC family ligand binding domain-containing protein n=1 Tax=Sphingopyxis sp. TaxID=1908224 RepID=UPI0025FACB28|nr:hypothetical protein [Sphingopyxis sp.]